MGWCLSKTLFSPSSSNSTTSSCSNSTTSHSLLFTTITAEEEACLDPLPLLPTSKGPRRCIDQTSCESSEEEEGTVLCARIDPREEVMRIGVRDGDEEGGKEGRIVIYKGSRSELLRTGNCSSPSNPSIAPSIQADAEVVNDCYSTSDGIDSIILLVPPFATSHNLSFLLVWSSFLLSPCFLQHLKLKPFSRRYEDFSALFTLSLTLGFLNLLPIPRLDGDHILSSFLSCLTTSHVSQRNFSSLPTIREGFEELEQGVLIWVVGGLGRMKVGEWIYRNRETIQRGLKVWTVVIGASLVGVTAVVLVGSVLLER